MNNRTLFILIHILLATTLAEAQSYPVFYTIKGDTSHIHFERPTIVLVYNDECCSACMKDLIYYTLGISKGTNTQILTMISSSHTDMLSLRKTTFNLQTYFVNKNMFPIVYDLHPKKRKQFYNKYKIKTFPCLFLIGNEGKKIIYIPYDELFGGKETISSKMLRKIADFIGTDITIIPQ